MTKPLTPRGEADHSKWMNRALQLARRAEGDTWPNPPVGCVIVRGRTVLGEGYHRRAGGPHAEVAALRKVKGSAQGATLYVTLEPCCSHGRTPPCTDAILSSGIKTVVVAVRDPDPRHKGRGIRLLKKAGIDVIEKVCRADATELLAPFSCRVSTGRPQTTLKVGMSLDGKLADSDGRSKWITGVASRKMVQSLRRRVDGIVAGVNTIISDDPTLTYRGPGTHCLRRYILDSRGRTPLQSKVLSREYASDTVIVVTDKCAASSIRAFESCGAQVWVLGAKGGRVSLKRFLRRCGDEGHLHLLFEGGGTLSDSCAREKIIDEFWFFVAPKLIGGARSVTARDGSGSALKGAEALTFTTVEHVGDDLLIKARPVLGRG